MFRERLKELQEKMAKAGKEISLRDLTGEITFTGIEFEDKLLNKKTIKVRFDTRW